MQRRSKKWCPRQGALENNESNNCHDEDEALATISSQKYFHVLLWKHCFEGSFNFTIIAFQYEGLTAHLPRGIVSAYALLSLLSKMLRWFSNPASPGPNRKVLQQNTGEFTNWKMKILKLVLVKNLPVLRMRLRFIRLQQSCNSWRQEEKDKMQRRNKNDTPARSVRNNKSNNWHDEVESSYNNLFLKILPMFCYAENLAERQVLISP